MQRKIRRQDITFMRPNSISQCLKCSICFQPFHEPTRLFCGHTFCWQCIQNWSKSHSNCPVCRQKIDSTNIGKDLLAYSIINELTVFCIHKDCSWKGPLEGLGMHVNFECLYDELAREGSTTQKANSMPGKFVAVDDEVEEKINENTSRGNLISRAMMKGNMMKQGNNLDVARKIIRAESHNQLGKTAVVEKRVKSSKKAQIEKKEDKIQEKEEEQKSGGGNYDFLVDLYDSK